ncbi:translation initiation factor IF-2-like [Sciurus carolinensis]|uniref:translation initiation factor IF-2-like n=1 Tax=Sciurus carolinensis TaxID=30640 RepID=UPI001FB1D8BD|nr:translation initiation factor IF-2-like [Sciurus carolinensis]
MPGTRPAGYPSSQSTNKGAAPNRKRSAAPTPRSKAGFSGERWMEAHGLGAIRQAEPPPVFLPPQLPLPAPQGTRSTRNRLQGSPAPTGGSYARTPARGPAFPLERSDSARAPSPAQRAPASSPHPRAHPGLSKPQPMVAAHSPRGGAKPPPHQGPVVPTGGSRGQWPGGRGKGQKQGARYLGKDSTCGGMKLLLPLWKRLAREQTGGGAEAADAAAAAVESPGQPRDRSPAGNRPAAPTTAFVPRGGSRAERQHRPPRLSPPPTRCVAEPGRAVFSHGPPRWGEVSVTNLLGLPVPARAVVAARAPGVRSRCGGPRPSKACVSSGRSQRAPAPKGRHTGTPPTGPPPFIFQLRRLRPRRRRAPPRAHCVLSPLCRPFLTPWVRRFSWKRRRRL